MKKLSFVLLMLSICVVMFAQSFETGVGNPAGRSAAVGDLYVNNLSNTIWRANSTTVGDWSRLPSLAQLQYGHVTFDVADAVSVGTITVSLDYAVNNVISSNTGNIVIVPDSVLPVQDLVVLYLDEADGADTLVVTPTNLASWTSVLLDSPDEFVHLKWLNGEWNVVLTTGTNQ